MIGSRTQTAVMTVTIHRKDGTIKHQETVETEPIQEINEP